MSHPITFQLDIILASPHTSETREAVKKELIASGFDAFVEGDLGDIEIDYDWGHEENLAKYLSALQTAPAITLYRYEDKDLLNLSKKLAQTFGDKISTRISTIKTQVWQEGWKDSFKPLQINEFYIFPPWEKPSRNSESLNIMINPGMAFGTGSHATTKLCLKCFSHWLSRENPPHKFHVLDVGTGTGVLALASRLAGANSVFATDIDPDAILAAKENAQANNVEIFAQLGSVKEVESFPCAPKKFDVVFANILLPVIIQLFSELVNKVSPNGILIISGIILSQEDDVSALAAKHSFQIVNRYLDEDWLALELSPRP